MGLHSRRPVLPKSTPLGRVLRAPLTQAQKLLLLAICERAAELPLQISDISGPLKLDRGDAERDGKALYRLGLVTPGHYTPSILTLAKHPLVEDALAVCGAKIPAAKVAAESRASLAKTGERETVKK